MKRIYAGSSLILIVIVLTACTTIQSLSPTSSAIHTTSTIPVPSNTFSPTNNETPAATYTPTAIPTPKIPVSLGTPIPQIDTAIDIENVAQIKMIADYKRFDPSKTFIKLTQDGKLYFVATENGIKVYSTQSKEVERQYDLSMTNPNVQVSSDGQRFAVRISTYETVVYNFEGRELFKVTYPEECNGEGDSLLSPDGKSIVVQSYSVCNSETWQQTFTVYDIDTKAVIYNNGTSPIGDAHGYLQHFSPDGKYLATGIYSQIYLWKTDDWARVSDYPADSFISDDSSIFSPDSTLIAIYGDEAITVWRVSDRQQIKTIDVCGDESYRALFSPDNEYIAVLSCQKINVWKIKDGTLISEQDTLYINLDGMFLNNDGKIVQYEPKPEPGIVYAPWDIWYFINSLELSDAGDSLLVKFIGHSYYSFACSINSDGNSLCEKGDYFAGSDGKYYLKVTDDSKLTQVIPGFDGNGTPLFSFSWDGYLMDPISLDVTHNLFYYQISMDGHNTTAYVMDITTGKNIAQWENMWIDGRVNYSPDGKMAAFVLTNSNNYRLVVFDWEQRQLIYQLDSKWVVGQLAFSPDSNYLLHFMPKPGDENADFYYILDLNNRSKSTRYQYPVIENAFATATSYSSDGTMIALGYIDGTIRLFNAQNGSILHEWKANNDRMSALTFSSDMKYLASASMDGTIRIWGILP